MFHLKSFDVFPKAAIESRRTTNEGGYVSLFGLLFAILLIVNETHRLVTPYNLERLDMLQMKEDVIRLELQVEFFHLQCSEINMGTSSSSG
jgi:Endoplasmic Reticulum-Golgi Intermediate Compartment (ERGIC)